LAITVLKVGRDSVNIGFIWSRNQLSSEPGREYILKELIENVRGSYDYIIIDSPPSLGL
jgi:cellulose biosynthesis protein BcsQ